MIDPFFGTRYLAKYASGLDENTKVKVKASKNKDELNVANEPGQNTKVTGSNINQKKAEMKKHQNPAFLGRAVGISEIVNLILGEAQVFTNITFIRMSSVPLEERPAF